MELEVSSGPKTDMDLFHLGLQIKYLPLFRVLQSSTKLVSSDQWKAAWNEMKLFRLIGQLEELRSKGPTIALSEPLPIDPASPLTNALHARTLSHPYSQFLQEIERKSIDFYQLRLSKQKKAYSISTSISDPNISSEDQVQPQGPLFAPPSDLPEEILPVHSTFSSASAPPWTKIEDDFILTAISGQAQDNHFPPPSSLRWAYIAEYINSHYHRGQYVRHAGSVRFRCERLLNLHVRKTAPVHNAGGLHRMTLEEKKAYTIRQYENLMQSFAIMKKRPHLRAFTRSISRTMNNQDTDSSSLSMTHGPAIKRSLLTAHASHDLTVKKLNSMIMVAQQPQGSSPTSGQAAPDAAPKVIPISTTVPGVTTPIELVTRKVQRTKAILEMQQASANNPVLTVPAAPSPGNLASQPRPTAPTNPIPSTGANPIPGTTPILVAMHPQQPSMIPLQYYHQHQYPAAQPVHPNMHPPGPMGQNRPITSTTSSQPMMVMMMRPPVHPHGARPVMISKGQMPHSGASPTSPATIMAAEHSQPHSGSPSMAGPQYYYAGTPNMAQPPPTGNPNISPRPPKA